MTCALVVDDREDNVYLLQSRAARARLCRRHGDQWRRGAGWPARQRKRLT
jgi:hypothetical protein